MSFDFGKYRALKKKREEREAIQLAGGGHAIAKALMQGSNKDTDFDYGANVVEDIDARIEREAADRCMGKTVCGACGKYHGYCAELTEDKEKQKMLPTGNQPTTGRKREGAMKWIKTEDLSTAPKEAKILMCRLNKNGKFGSRVELKLAFEGQIAYLGVPPNMEATNYAVLINKFGPEENEWIDKRILLFLEKDKFSEQYYIRIDIPAPEKPGRGR